MGGLLLSVLPTALAGPGILWPDVCTQDDVKGLPFCNQKLSWGQRADDYVSRLTAADKIPMMMNGAKGVDHLHIPMYQWGSEGLHGPLQPCVPTGSPSARCPTSFPCPSTMGSTFNDTLYHLVGRADGREARAINNNRDHVAQNQYGDGIDYWSPTINMQRDPRWGRNQEVPGEDPVLTSRYAVNFVQGLQNGEDNTHRQILSCCKHFVANSLENWMGHTRHNFDANVTPADLADYYLPAFKACVTEGGSQGIMCSYNAVNGKPMCANSEFLNQTLRNEWGFQGYVTSDCGAVADIYNPEPQGHGYAAGPEAAADALLAGTDVNCGGGYGANLPAALQQGLVKEADVDRALKRLTRMQMSLGLFDAKAKQPYFNYGLDHIDTPEHQQLALEAARQSVVLLQNSGVLPLKPGTRIAASGPHVNATEAMLSNYHGDRCVSKQFECVETPLAAVTKANAGGVTQSSAGCDIAGNSTAGIAAAVAQAKAADVAVLFVGLDQSQEREGLDRTIITLPGVQAQLVEQVAATGKPVVLVLMNGGTVSLGDLRSKVAAIVGAGYGGQSGGRAIADVLFGAYNPTGRLAATVYPTDYAQKLPLTEMGITVPPGRTHLHYTGTPEFSFGTGLSYTSFALSFAVPPDTSAVATGAGWSRQYKVRVTNTGAVAGGQTVHAYVRPQQRGLLRQRLFDYAGVPHLAPGESTVLTFALQPSHLAVAAASGDRVLSAGQWAVEFTAAGNAKAGTAVHVVGPDTVSERFPKGL